MNGDKRQITVPEFVGFKQQNHRISMLTAYDYITAKILDESGIEAILVGDTVGMVFQGHDTTSHSTTLFIMRKLSDVRLIMHW